MREILDSCLKKRSEMMEMLDSCLKKRSEGSEMREMLDSCLKKRSEMMEMFMFKEAIKEANILSLPGDQAREVWKILCSHQPIAFKRIRLQQDNSGEVHQ
ncbi:hypothetical protein AgCh_002805 [Apium graveolens]